MASLSMILPTLDSPKPVPVKIEKEKSKPSDEEVPKDSKSPDEDAHEHVGNDGEGELVINAENQTDANQKGDDKEPDTAFEEGPGEGTRSRSCQSATWDELAMELVLEVVTQQVTKVQGVQQTPGSGSSCVHLGGMTWKDIVSMIVMTHNKNCKHTGVTLTHNMVGMTGSLANETAEGGSVQQDDGPPNLVKMVDEPERASPVKRTKRTYKPRAKRARFDDQSKTSNGMTSFESEFQKTVESILTGQVPAEDGPAEGSKGNAVTTAVDIEEDDLEIVQCPECKRWFKSKEQLKKHKPVHDPDRGPHKCEHCEVSFPTEWDLQKHIPAAHRDKLPEPEVEEQSQARVKVLRPSIRRGRGRGVRMRGGRGGRGRSDRGSDTVYKCDRCEHSFRTLGGLERHQQAHIETIITVDKQGNVIGKPEVERASDVPLPSSDIRDDLAMSAADWNYKCQVCKEGFRSKMLLAKHREIHSEKNGEQKCPECNKQCRTQWNLRRHLLIHKKIKKHKCTEPNCEASYGIKLKLDQHKAEAHTVGQTYTCPTCNLSYKSKTTLKYHMMEHGESKDFVCNFCNKSFSRPDALRHHQVQHKPKKFNCTLCSNAYPFKSLLIRHWRNMHQRENTVKCEFCDERFANYYQKNSHEEIHTGVKRFVCNICGEGFTQKGALSAHEKLHPEIMYQCPECPRTFKGKHNLARHKRSHDGNLGRTKMFKCSFCESSFHWKHQWQDHENRHKGIKPHHCNVCEASFVARCDLSRHMKIHAGHLSYRCAYCDRKYASKAAMEKHEMEEHLQFETDEMDDSSNVVVFKLKK